MNRSKRENANMLDPNRFKIAQQNAVLPGGPQNNNPMNVTDFAAPPIQAQSIYGDHNQNYAQMGAAAINPMQYGPSGLNQNTPAGQGLNANSPYNLQQQPMPNAEEPMEGMRLGENAMKQGLMAHPFLGMTGSPAIIPGAMDPQIPGQGNPLMQPMVTMDGPQGNNVNSKKGKK